MAGTFRGKVALVTGAGSGLGRASALAFAREGAVVWLCSEAASYVTGHIMSVDGGFTAQ